MIQDADNLPKKAELPSRRPAGVQKGLASPHLTSLLSAPTVSQVINSCRTEVLCKVVQQHLGQAGNRGLAVSTAFHTKDRSCLSKT